MTPEENAFRVDALLSLMRAMWDMVTPELRSVSIRVVPASEIALRFVFDHSPTDEEMELVSDIEGELWADFSQDTKVSSVCEFVPVTERRELAQGEEWVYLRREV